MITLMLPPVPGTNTAHPAFDIVRGKAWFWLLPRSRHGHRIVFTDPAEWAIVAAAAIAFYWYRHMCSHLPNGIHHPLYRQAREEYDKWADIAAGSHGYNNAEIVAYKES